MLAQMSANVSITHLILIIYIFKFRAKKEDNKKSTISVSFRPGLPQKSIKGRLNTSITEN